MEPLPPAELEPPPPGFAEHPGARGLAPGPTAVRGARGDLIATPVDDELDVIELSEVVSPPPRAPAGSPEGPSEIIDILQGRAPEGEGPMSDTLAALYGQGRGDEDEDDDDDDALAGEPVAEEVDEALSALAGAGARARGAGPDQADKPNSWYIVSDEVEYGPYSGQAILAAVQSGRLRPHIVLHDSAAEVEVTVAQLVQAMVRQGRMNPPGQRAAKGTPGTQSAARPAPTARTATPATTPRSPQAANLPAPPAPVNPEPTAPVESTRPAPSPSPSVSHNPQVPSSPLSPGLAGDGTSAVPPAALSSAHPSPAPVPPPTPVQSLAAVAAAAAAAPVRLARPRRTGLTLPDTALLLALAALAAAAVGLLLPWLAGVPGARASLRLGELARPWAYALGGLTLGAAALAGAMLPLRRWSGRRLACACLVVLCLADLLVQGLALSDIHETTGLAVRVGVLGAGAWLSAGGALAGGFLAAFAAATIVHRTRARS